MADQETVINKITDSDKRQPRSQQSQMSAVTIEVKGKTGPHLCTGSYYLRREQE